MHIDLGEACLELHSHKGSKKELHQELKRVLELGKPALQHLEQHVSLLDAQRAELNDYSKAVNTEIGESGITPHQVMGYLLQLQQVEKEASWPNLQMAQMQNWDVHKAIEAFAFSDKVQALLQNIKVPSQAIFWGSDLLHLLPHQLPTLQQQLESATQAISNLHNEANGMAAILQVPPTQNREEALRLATVLELAAAQPPLKDEAIAETQLAHLAKGT